METIELEYQGNFDHLIGTATGDAAPPQKTITRDTVMMHKGECVGVYYTLPARHTAPLRGIATGTKYDSTSRTSGLPTQSSVYGALPRNALRVDYCRYTRKSMSERGYFADAFRFAETLSEIYRAHLPEQYEAHMALIGGSVHDDWRPTTAPFTTCNFNVNHAIRYHRDSGNFKGVMSNILILREHCTGGELVFPEFGVQLAQGDGALAIIDGQKWIHGVRPLKMRKRGAYRASVVYYALEGMGKCYPYAEERARFTAVRTKRSRSRAAGNPSLKK